MILILVIVFLVLGCSFSCNRKKEHFAFKDCLKCLSPLDSFGKRFLCGQRYCEATGIQKEALLNKDKMELCRGCSGQDMRNNFNVLKAANHFACTWSNKNCARIRSQR